MIVVFIRTIIVFVVMLVSIRIMGKRQLGELEPLELVVAVLISDLAAQPLEDLGTPLLYGLIPVLTMFSCQVLVAGITMKNSKLRGIICGKPSILIDNGVINQSEMHKNRIALDELSVELRQNGVTDISAVKHAILETNGTLSILLYPAEAPITPRQMNIAVDDPGSPITIISDGHIMSENLKLAGYNEKWLCRELEKRRINDPKSVYLMNVDKKGQIYFAVKEASI